VHASEVLGKNTLFVSCMFATPSIELNWFLHLPKFINHTVKDI